MTHVKDTDPWYKCPWDDLILPARRRFWQEWHGHHTVRTSDCVRHGEHNTLTLLWKTPDLPHAVLIQFFRMNTEIFEVPAGEATIERIKLQALIAMGEFIARFLKHREACEQDLAKFHREPFVRRDFFLDTPEPEVNVEGCPGGITTVWVEHKVSHLIYPTRLSAWVVGKASEEPDSSKEKK